MMRLTDGERRALVEFFRGLADGIEGHDSEGSASYRRGVDAGSGWIDDAVKGEHNLSLMDYIEGNGPSTLKRDERS